MPLMRIIITGGSGFIGSFAVKKFLTENHKVLNIDNLTYKDLCYTVLLPLASSVKVLT